MPGPFGPDQSELGPDQTGEAPETTSGDGGGTTAPVALTDADLDAIAARLLDLPDTIEPGVTLRGALRAILSEAAHRVRTNRESRTWAFYRKDGERVALSGEFDADGNRTNVVYGDLT